MCVENNEILTENEWLRKMVNDRLETQDENGHFTDDVKECVFELLKHNVSYSNSPPVINAVLRLGKLQAKELPSKTTIHRWNLQRLLMAQKKLCEELPAQRNMGFLSNETSKYGQKDEGFHVSDPSGHICVLGVYDIMPKAGCDVSQTFKSILEDIENRAEDTKDEYAKKILLNISCSISDHASTHIKFNMSF